MHVPIDPQHEYRPSEIAEYGWILNTLGKKDYRYIITQVDKGRLRARVVVRGHRNKDYFILGQDIITFKKSTGTFTIPEQPEEFQRGTSGKYPFPQPPKNDNEQSRT